MNPPPNSEERREEEEEEEEDRPNGEAGEGGVVGKEDDGGGGEWNNDDGDGGKSKTRLIADEGREDTSNGKVGGRDGEEDQVDNNGGGGGNGKSGICWGNKQPSKSPVAIGFGSLFRFSDGIDRALMAIGTIGAIVHGCALPVYFRFFAELVDSFGSNADDLDVMVREVTKYSLYFLAVGATIWVSSWAEISSWTWTGERQATKMRIRYLESVLRQDVGYFDVEVRTSDIIHAMNADAVSFQDGIGEKLGNFIHYVARFVSGFVVGFTAVWQLALVTLAVVPLIAVTGVVYTVVAGKLSSRCQDALLEAGTIANQALSQIKIVKSFTGESRVLKAYSSALRTVQRIGYKSGLAKGVGLGAINFAAFTGHALLLWYGGVLVRSHQANGGLAVSTIFSVFIGGLALGQSAPSMIAFTKARVAAARIYSTIDRKPKINQEREESGVEIEAVSGHIELRNVHFAYPSRPETPVLRGFSLDIEAGKTLALVGSSGSGKSTIVSLIERFYDPNSGEVLLDGCDVRTLKLRFLRQQIGLVSQEPAIFATTIRENILLGRPNATDEELQEAAMGANAHFFIMNLPQGYDSQVGERGLQLSGGERQRIAMARAMLKNPAILLLDEATSALDSESETLVQEALDGFTVGRTTVVIAHRLSTIRRADVVAVLQQGHLYETGTHDELMAEGTDGVYAELIRMQEKANEARARRSNARASEARSSLGSSPVGGRSPSPGQSPRSVGSSEATTASEFSLALNRAILREQASSFWRLAKMNRPEWAYALLASMGSMACGSFTALFAYVLSAVLSVYYDQDHKHMEGEINKYCYVLVGVSTAKLVFGVVQHLFWDVVGENLTKRVRQRMLSAVLCNEMAWFDEEQNFSSRISARITVAAHNVRSAVGDRISVIAQNLALILVACTIGLVLEWRLALVLMAVFPIVVAATVLQKMFMKGFFGDMEAVHAKATQIAGEAVENIKAVAAYNSEARIIQLFSGNLQAPLRRSIKRGHVVGFGFGVAQFLLYASYALGLWYASWLVSHRVSDFSRSIRVFVVLVVSANGAADVLAMAPDFIKGGHALSSVFDVLDRRAGIDPDHPGAPPVPDLLRGEVSLKHVDFAYPSHPDLFVFRGLNLQAQPGTTLALVGPSGCGKSTVVSLVQRFYEPTSGSVLVDGKDIRRYNLTSLRRAMAFVPQEPLLFGTTIHDNIVYGRENATEAEVVEAATMANAHKFVSELPDGYRTLVGERGVQLSGGQRQRIAIARALVKKAPIMLLDEATSALDIESDHYVQKALRRALKGQTTIVVAHRLWTVSSAHAIAVIDNGTVVEKGSHVQLLRNFPDGFYARMLRLQHIPSI